MEVTLTATFTVTVEPFTMVTSSAAVGTTPPAQLVVAFQLPPVAVLEIAAGARRISSLAASPNSKNNNVMRGVCP